MLLELDEAVVVARESALMQSEALAFAGDGRECCAVVVMLRGELM